MGIIRNNELSLKAKGLYFFLMDSSDSFTSSNQISLFNKDGRESVRSAIDELEKHGYLRRIRVKNPKGEFVGYKYEILK